LWAPALVAGFIAGVFSFLSAEVSKTAFKPRRITAISKGRSIQVATRREQAISDAKNAGLAFTIVGGLLSAGLGAAGGLARGSFRAAATTGFLGLALGIAAGLGASAAVLTSYNAYIGRHPEEASQSIILPVLVHVGIYTAIGAAGGFAFAIGLAAGDRVLPCILGAMAGAGLAAIVFDVTYPAIFPLAQATQIVSETWRSRLISRLAVTMLAAIGVAYAGGRPRRRKAQ
jgi:hypothetical protein